MDNVNISDLVPSTSTNVEGVFVRDLSPIKTSRKNPNVKGRGTCQILMLIFLYQWIA